MKKRMVLLALCLCLALGCALAEQPSARVVFSTDQLRLPDAGFCAGDRGVAVGGAFYCVESDGVYRFDGTRRTQIASGFYIEDGGILCDG